MKKQNKIIYSIIGVILLVFTFTDLQITEAIYNPSSSFGWFFEAFGEVIMSLIGAFSSLYLFRTQQENIIFKLLEGLAFIFNILTGCILMMSYLKLSHVVTIILGVLLVIILFLLTSRVPTDKEKTVRQVSKVGLFISLMPVLIITIVKMIWGRQRYRAMTNPSIEFTKWFIPQGFTTDNEFMSFPSGHSANSATILWITLLPLIMDRLKGRESLLRVVAAIWIICVMISRVMVGAHFASDVLIGATVTLTLFLIAKRKFLGDLDV